MDDSKNVVVQNVKGRCAVHTIKAMPIKNIQHSQNFAGDVPWNGRILSIKEQIITQVITFGLVFSTYHLTPMLFLSSCCMYSKLS